MFIESETPDTEPPLSSPQHPLGSFPGASDCATDFMLSVARPRPETHALVIGRHTLDPVLALMKFGCESVASQALGAPIVRLDQASLAWIAECSTATELAAAVHQASNCLGPDGSIVLDATALNSPTAESTARQCLADVGFRLGSVLRRGQHLILTAARGPQLALAA